MPKREKATAKITVIIPVLNMYPYLRECLDSAISQTIDGLEIICIDDGSTDGSYELLQEYSQSYSNIYLLTQDREGPGVARNRAIDIAKGEYVCMMDADDYYPNDGVLELLYTTAIEQHVEMCGGNIENIYPDGTVIADSTNFKQFGLLNSLEYPRMFGQTRFVYESRFLKENELRYLPYVRFEDPPFVMEAILRAGKYYALKDTVYVRRTGYKNNGIDSGNALGVLAGIEKCTRLAAEYDLKLFFEQEIVYLLANNFSYIYHDLCDEHSSLWETVSSINSICLEYGHENSRPFFNYESFRKYVESIREMVHRLKETKKAIVYGTGIVAHRLLESGYLDEQAIIGFATTDYPQKSTILGKEVRRVKDICTDFKMTYIVAAGNKNADEMAKTLREIGITNYIKVTGTMIGIAKEILSA